MDLCAYKLRLSVRVQSNTFTIGDLRASAIFLSNNMPTRTNGLRYGRTAPVLNVERESRPSWPIPRLIRQDRDGSSNVEVRAAAVREAARLFGMASSQGHVRAQLELGCLLASCEADSPVPRDVGRAARLLAAACLSGDAPGSSAEIRARALAMLAGLASEREVVSTCCIGCGASGQFLKFRRA
jgi:TPR repeat protein